MVLIPFSHLWFYPISLKHQEICHDCREDGSWLFLAAVMSKNPNTITGHNGAQIICNKGTLTQTLFFVTTFIFCGHFLGVTLTVKCCQLFTLWFMAFLLRLALGVMITLAERLTEGRCCKEVPLCVSLLPGSCVLSPQDSN